MNHQLKFLLLMNCMALPAVHGYAQTSTSGYTITGTLDGLEDGTMLYLRTANRIGHRDTLATARSKGNSFVFTGKLPAEYVGREYNVTLDAKDERYRKVYTKDILLYPDNTAMTLTGTMGQFKPDQIMVTGSQVHADFVAYNQYMDKKLNQYIIDFVRPAYFEFERILRQDTAANAKQLLAGTDAFYNYMTSKRKKNIAEDWMKMHPSSSFAPSLMSLFYTNTLAQNETIYAAYSDNAKNSYYGRQLKAEIDACRKAEPGQSFQFVNLKDRNGKAISLEKIAAGSELTIVDFWAYWCGPCRANFPHLKNLYSKYKDKGLTLYTVSIDTTYKPWLQALDQEQMPWSNVVVDKLGQETELYGIKAVPTSFLIDKKGKILGHWVGNMHDLEDKIKQYLKL